MTSPAWVELPDTGDGPGLRLVLPLPPSANRYWVSAPRRGLVLSAESKAYKTQVSWLLVRCRALLGSLSVSGTVYRPRRSGDLGNYLKCLEDALQGWAYLDDGQIAEYRHLRRAEDPSSPRVELEIRGEAWATREQEQASREGRRVANVKRKKTIRENRRAARR